MGGTLSNLAGMLIKGEIWMQTDRHAHSEIIIKHESRDQVMCLQVKERQKLPANPRSYREAWTRPLAALRRN